MKQLLEHLGWVPRVCVWELTRACNLRCEHCGSSAGEPREHELTKSECLEVVRQLGRLGNRLTTFSGGEPTLRRDWTEIARACADQGIVVNLVTNGQTDAVKLASMAKEAGLANVAVSLDGLETTHDALRTKGSFLRATRAIQELAGAGIWVDVVVTVNRKNKRQLAAIHGLASELGARGLRAQLGKPMGNQTLRPDLTLTPHDLLELLPSLGRLALKGGPRVHLGDSLGFYSPEERWLRGLYCGQGHWTGCYAGCQAIGIQSDGGVKGCLSLQPRAGEPDPFIESNVRQQSLAAIWQSAGAFSYNRLPSAQRLHGHCAQCGHATLCRGGAKCVAYAYTGSLGYDPMCYLAIAQMDSCWSDRVWPASGAAAAAAVLVGLGAAACPQTTSTGRSEADASKPGGLEAATELAAASYKNVCCTCDYGLVGPISGSG